MVCMSMLKILLSGLMLAGAVWAEGDRPNILFVLADDHGFDALSCTGAEGIQTPNIDRLCEEGMTFNDFYVYNRCSPTRLSFMTGSHCQRAGWTAVIYRWSLVGINREEITTPELLQQAGYATGMVGKWHLGEYEPFNPVNHGFDSFYGFMKYEGEKSGLYRNTELVKKVERKTDCIHSDQLVEAGIEFIRTHQDEPFFLYYASPLPHQPWIPSERFKGTSEKGNHGDTMHDLDWQVGELLKTLDELGLAEKTLVIYTADNGPQLNFGGEEMSGIYRDGKWSNFEGGIRVPCFMRWPGTIPPETTYSGITAIYDLLPTFCELAGTEPPTDRVIDGKSFLPVLLGETLSQPVHESYLVNDSTFRYNDWKLISKKMKPGGAEKFWGDRTAAADGSLFNLKNDPGETTDVSTQYPEVVQELTRRMQSAMKELKQNAREIGKTPDFSSEKSKALRKQKEGY